MIVSNMLLELGYFVSYHYLRTYYNIKNPGEAVREGRGSKVVCFVMQGLVRRVFPFLGCVFLERSVIPRRRGSGSGRFPMPALARDSSQS